MNTEDADKFDEQLKNATEAEVFAALRAMPPEVIGWHLWLTGFNGKHAKSILRVLKNRDYPLRIIDASGSDVSGPIEAVYVCESGIEDDPEQLVKALFAVNGGEFSVTIKELVVSKTDCYGPEEVWPEKNSEESEKN